MTTGRVLRLSLDLNVLYQNQKARDLGIRGTAARMLVDAIRDGTCPAGPVQLVTSVPVIENWADVLRRRFGFTPDEAREKADLLYDYAREGPLPEGPRVVVGAGHVPFGSEHQVQESIRTHLLPGNADKLFDELADDRNVLLSALAGRADILATSDTDLFTKGDAIVLERKDVVLHPFGGRTLVVANPAFVAYWLRQGIIPDADFVASRPEDFMPAPQTAPRA